MESQAVQKLERQVEKAWTKHPENLNEKRRKHFLSEFHTMLPNAENLKQIAKKIGQEIRISFELDPTQS